MSEETGQWPVEPVLRALRDIDQPVVVPHLHEYDLSRGGQWGLRLHFDRVLDIPAPEQRRQYLRALDKHLMEESDASDVQ